MAKKSKRRSHMEHRGIVSWDEEDAFTSWKHLYCYLNKPGAKAFIKRKANRRRRSAVRAEIRSGSWV